MRKKKNKKYKEVIFNLIVYMILLLVLVYSEVKIYKWYKDNNKNNEIAEQIKGTVVVEEKSEDKEEYTIVESTQKGIMQHDLYTLQILGKKFVTAKELTNDSVFIDKTITSWLEKVEPTKREQVIDVIFEILSNTDAQTMKELKANWFVNARTILTSYKNIDNETKELVWQTLNELFKATKDNLNQWGR